MRVFGRIRWLGAGLLLAATLALVWWMVARRAGETLRLPDGRRMTVIAVTQGTNHVYVSGNSWLKMGQRFMPYRLATRLGLVRHQLWTPIPSMVIWTRWWTSTNPAPRFAAVGDRHGVESEPRVASLNQFGATTNEALVTWTFENCPRHQGQVLLRLYDRDEVYRPLRRGELSVSIPSSASIRVGPTASLPVSVRAGETEFSLVGLRPGQPFQEDPKRPYVFVARWTAAAFSLREQGQANTDWTIRSFRAQSGQGNEFVVQQPLAAWQNGVLTTSFSDVLWADDPEWRFFVEFVRTRNFRPAELWTLRGLPVSRTSPPYLSSVQSVVQGIRITALDIRPTTQIPRVNSNRPRRTTDVTVIYTRADPRDRLDLAGAKDHLGREVPFAGGVELWPGKYVAGLDLSSEVKSIDLTFACHRGIEVQFPVKLNPRK